MQKRRVLHILLSIGETSAPYNEHCLPMSEEREISICTYRVPKISIPSAIRLYSGRGRFGSFFRAMRTAFRARPYDIFHLHTPQVACLFLFATLFKDRHVRRAGVYTVHNSYPSFKWLHKLMLLVVFAFFPAIVCCSKASLLSFPWFYKKLAGKRLTYVQNGIDVARVDRILHEKQIKVRSQESGVRSQKVTVTSQQPIGNRQQAGGGGVKMGAEVAAQAESVQAVSAKTSAKTMTLPNNGRAADADDFTVLSVGRLIDIKDPFMVLSAFSQAQDADCSLLYVGEGPHQAALVDQSKKSGIAEQVRFTGLIPRDSVYQIMSEADVYISASWGEGLPIAVLEAMACRCPVILSDIPPHQEIAGEDGFIPLVRPGDEAGFANALNMFRQMLPINRKRIAEHCRKRVEEHFSLEAMHRGYDAIYNRLLGVYA